MLGLCETMSVVIGSGRGAVDDAKRARPVMMPSDAVTSPSLVAGSVVMVRLGGVHANRL